jgi:hypothetical protein
MVAEAEARPEAEAGRDQARPEPEPEEEVSTEIDAEWWAQAERDIAAAAEGGPSLADWWHQVQNPEPEPESGHDEPEPEAADTAAMYAEIHEDLAAIGDGIRELSARADEEASRRAEAQQEILNEPSPWQQPQAQAEAAAEASWQPGEAVADDTEADMEAEI